MGHKGGLKQVHDACIVAAVIGKDLRGMSQAKATSNSE